ncbi:amidase [Nonomuraea turkmeniaca]|uniref:Amidase n=1 Tax=Nonomuraea turkmeniaca TaxID=103838 RepID=A0A5S4FUA1_9ACTN|nr:amidase family protein [Nonomuraea turkmeniaca]TMR24249.1 amidase [Nonomuraea turkmeniaca]
MLWAGRTATEIATAVRHGDVSATTVVEEHLHVISERDPEVGAFRRVREQAVEEAQAVQKRPDLAELPLAGVPVAVKDNLEVAGEATRGGSAGTADVPAPADHATVARLRAAGAVVVGLTNLPELGLVAFGDSAYGIVRNPWDRTRTPGGSSSGSAAAVAAGMVPIALGNDGMGSLRIPAAACGVLAVKPGADVVPPPADDWNRLTENGPLATTVSDLALTLSVLAADPSLAEAWRGGRRVDPRPPMLRSVWADDDEVWEPQPPPDSPEPFDLRVAYAPQPLPIGLPMDKEFQAAVRAAAETLRVAGHTVVEHGHRLPAWLGPATIATWLSQAAMSAAEMDRRTVERRTRALARAGRALTRMKLDGVRGRERWSAYGADQWFGDADVLITPSLGTVPPRADRWGERGFLRNVLANVRFAPATGAWNMCGWPAITVPIATHTSGLPIGVQLIAPPGGEPHLLGLAAQLQSAHPPVRPRGYH